MPFLNSCCYIKKTKVVNTDIVNGAEGSTKPSVHVERSKQFDNFSITVEVNMLALRLHYIYCCTEIKLWNKVNSAELNVKPYVLVERTNLLDFFSISVHLNLTVVLCPVCLVSGACRCILFSFNRPCKERNLEALQEGKSLVLNTLQEFPHNRKMKGSLC